MLAIKLAVTPLMMLAISLAARQWGSLIAGLLSGLPLTSGPISVYMAIEQGDEFAHQAAFASLAGLASVLVAYLAYVLLTPIWALPVVCAICLAIFSASSWVLLSGASAVLSVAIAVAMMALLLWVTRRSASAPRPSAARTISLPVRLITATALVLLTTSFARVLGPQISGVISLIPIIAWPLTVFAHLEGGRDNALIVVRGNAISAIGVVAFYLVVAEMILSRGPLVAFSAGTAAALAAAVLVGLMMRPRGASRA